VWDSRAEREHALTIAPWNGQATVRYQDGQTDLRFTSAELSQMEFTEPSRNVESQLAALGYRGVG